MTPNSEIRRTLSLYSPHQGQRQIHESRSRFNIVCFGRQSGKTTYGLNKIADRAWCGPKSGIYWYVLQTYDAATVAFRRMKDFYLATPQAFTKRPNESELSCQFKHGPMIFFKSGKNYEDLRVETLDGAVIDEMRQQHPDLWPRVVRPMLGKKQGWADILSTPNGYEHFSDLFEKAKEDNDWSWFHAPSTVAPWWTENEIASARKEMSDDEFAQEIMAEFREIGRGKAYINHGAWNKKEQNPFAITGIQWSPYLPIVVGADFNVGKMCWELLQVKGEDFYCGDEIVVANTNTQETAPLLVEKVRGHKPGVILLGDASGSSRKTSAAGETDYSILMQALKSAGIPVRNLTPESNPLVKDRVNLFNSRLRTADGSTHFWYHPKRCKQLGKDLERVAWKQGADGAILDKTDPELTHASDGAGYPVAYYTGEFRNRPGVLRVIPR